MEQKPEVSLDEILDEVAGHVTLRGVKHNVLHVNAAEFQLVRDWDWSSPEIEPIRATAQRVCPSIDAGALPLKAVGRVIAVAMGMAERVETDLPNSSGPVAETPPAESPKG